MAYDPEIDVDETEPVDVVETVWEGWYSDPEDEDGIEYRPATGTASVIRRAY